MQAGLRSAEGRCDPRWHRACPERGDLQEARGPQLFRMRKVEMGMGWSGGSHRLSAVGQALCQVRSSQILTEHLLYARQCSGCQGFRSEQKQCPCSPGAYFLLEWNQMIEAPVSLLTVRAACMA